MCAKSNRLGGDAALLLTCTVLPMAHRDALLQKLHSKGAINSGEKNTSQGTTWYLYYSIVSTVKILT